MAEMRKRKSLEPHCFVVYWRCGCLPRLGRELSRGLQSGISQGGAWKSLVGMCKTKAWSIGRKMGEGRTHCAGNKARNQLFTTIYSPSHHPFKPSPSHFAGFFSTNELNFV